MDSRCPHLGRFEAFIGVANLAAFVDDPEVEEAAIVVVEKSLREIIFGFTKICFQCCTKMCFLGDVIRVQLLSKMSC